MRAGLDAERHYPSINPPRRQCSKSAHGRLCEVAFMSESILIVDDDPVARRLLDNMVRKFGYEPLIAETGDQAATLLLEPNAERIDGVVLDLVMPDLDGLGVLARLREASLNIPVIVQTAHGGIDNVVSAM